ncbi:unnamed protein product [Adineta ricciae]|uniref:Uncharacterized protein n=1 Tax=Adineta ricciae TaxID=249248 RepID=A0A814YD55_ADIRI|nr:unnamed protein product [Adineta ricciae]CAF1227253.1 unnamed protein product [Adineta ricciae]
MQLKDFFLNTTVEQFYQSTLYNFSLVKDYYFSRSSDSNLIFNDQTGRLQFIPSGTSEINATKITCFCAINPDCRSSTVLYRSNPNSYGYFTTDSIVSLVGLVRGCLHIDSLLISTLQCFYVSSRCFPTFLAFSKPMHAGIMQLESSSLRIQPMAYDPTVHPFSPNPSVLTIVKKLMIENWYVSLSYEHFYETCAPTYCSYLKKIRNQTLVGLFIKLVSIITGMVSVLRIVAPQLVGFMRKLRKICDRKPKQTQPIRCSTSDQLKIAIQNLKKLIRTTIVELYIFGLRDTGSTVDRLTAKRYG